LVRLPVIRAGPGHDFRRGGR